MPAGAEPIAFSAQTRVSGLQIGDRSLIKGAVDAVLKRVGSQPGAEALIEIANGIARAGGTPLSAKVAATRSTKVRSRTCIGDRALMLLRRW